MDVESLTKQITLVGAVVAACTGVWSLWLQMRGKRDHYSVGTGTVRPEIIRETMIHVVSHSDHPIYLADYGFIDPNFKFSSILLEQELHDFQDKITCTPVAAAVSRSAATSSKLATSGATLPSVHSQELLLKPGPASDLPTIRRHGRNCGFVPCFW